MTYFKADLLNNESLLHNVTLLVEEDRFFSYNPYTDSVWCYAYDEEGYRDEENTFKMYSNCGGCPQVNEHGLIILPKWRMVEQSVLLDT